MNTGLWITLGIIAVVVVALILMYNNLITLRNRVKNAFAQIDVQLQRRYDLIPNLVETAKSYMEYEQETLTAVIEARNTAISAKDVAAADPSNEASIKSLLAAEGALQQGLGKLFALAENYPDLKANTTMQQLMEELTTTENKISFSRQAYNDAVMSYNIGREKFPQNLIANSFNFQHAGLWELENVEAKQAIKVSFD